MAPSVPNRGKRYFTGIPCRNGHICERKVSTGQCVECVKVGIQKYNAAHPDKVRERQRRWQEKNRDKTRKWSREWAAKNPDKVKEHSRKHYEIAASDPATVIERRKKTRIWAINNPEKHSAGSCRWQARHPEKALAIQQTRRARKLGASGKFTKADTDRLFEIQGGKCALPWCRTSISTKRHVDHVIPLALGGSNDPSNLQLLCPTCNHKKGAKHPVAFAQQNGMLL